MATPASTLLLDEYFESGDPRFLAELYAITNGKWLKSFAKRWVSDMRPFAREMLLRYIDDGCLRPGHRIMVKQLFKLSETAQTDDVMARFMVAFDRMPRRKMGVRYAWDNVARRSTQQAALVSDLALSNAARPPQERARFSRRTRLYLARRAWRYFRKIGRKDGARYLHQITTAVMRYADESLQKPEQFLDAWSLVHALYWGAPILDRRRDGIELRPNTGLADLLPSPMYPQLWRDAFEPLLQILAHGQARTVRVWAATLLRDQHAGSLRTLGVDRIRALLRAPFDDVQELAIELLKNSQGLDALPIDAWLELLRMENPAVVNVVCTLVERHVAPERLSLSQCVDLACAGAAPVAELGLRWVKKRTVQSRDDVLALTRLANARAPIVRADAVAWLITVLEREREARPEHLREVLDARYTDARAAALAMLERNEPMQSDVGMWAALAESPYDDVRDALVRRMEDWHASLSPESLRHIWSSALLAIHRGSRSKPRVLLQIAERLRAHRDETKVLVPLLRLGLRSVRPAERRAALAAVARAAFGAPELREALGREFPELSLWQEKAS